MSTLPTPPSHTVNTQYTKTRYLHVVCLYFSRIFTYFYSIYLLCLKQNANVRDNVKRAEFKIEWLKRTRRTGP